MQSFGRVGTFVCALALVAATAYADPFTLGRDTQTRHGGSAAWFGNPVKLDGAFFGREVFLTNATISVGGQSITVPSATITFGTSGTAFPSAGGSSSGSSGYALSGSGFLFGGGFSASSGGASINPKSSRSLGGNSASISQVPGAAAAFNPFNPGLGAIVGGGNAGGNSGAALSASNGQGANIVGSLGLTGPGGTISTAALATTAVPDTPEPSPLLLLATGLGVFFFWKKREALKRMTA